MSHDVSREKSQEAWNAAIVESKEMLARVEAKAGRLRTNIKVLEQGRDAGELWPMQSAGQDSEQQHSV
jgi:hypothetical protein